MKTHKKEIKYNPNQEEYIIKIKKRCKWCWLLLLLLLLPLLLLIPLKKDVKFKVLNSHNNSVVEGLNVSFAYVKRDLFNFKTHKFFTREYRYKYAPYYSDTTNEKGIVVIKNIKYTVYQWLFRNKDTTRTFAAGECFKLDTIIHLFKLKRENTVYTTPATLDFEFTVVDADDNNEALPDALVRIKSDKLSTSDSVRSDNAGKVIFKKIPKCSNIEVIGSKYGWYNDTIKGNARNIYQKDDTLFLKQEKVIVKFFVKDLFTKKPLVKAHGKLFFKSDPEKQVGKDAITNTNGVAKGVFENVHKIKKIRIDVNKRKELIYYNDSSTVDYLSYINVESWNKRSDKQKIIYLRPNPNPILFQDIDCKTKRGLSNVENTVLIVKSNGTKIGPVAIFSDKNGNFSISAGMGDKITIKAKTKSICPNEYLPNTTTIVNALYDNLKDNAAKRKIPLCKKQAPQLQFKNIDKESKVALSGVRNRVNVQGGGSFSYTSKSDGSFMVTDVYECQIISIVASKSGYETNSTSVVKKKFDALRTNSNDRIIPLKKKRIPPPQDDEFDGEAGDLRVNLQWKTLDDLDLYITDPCGKTVWALALTQTCSGGVGTLDVDANTNRYPESTWTKRPQENAFWEKPTKGKYKIQVKHCNKQDRSSPDPVKFNVTIIHEGKRSDFKGQVNVENKVYVTTFVVK